MSEVIARCVCGHVSAFHIFGPVLGYCVRHHCPCEEFQDETEEEE